MPSSSFAIYVHVPFCARHCPYCDFNTFVERAQSPLVDRVVDAICLDVAGSASGSACLPDGNGRPRAATIFFGGGTPTLLTSPQLDRILDAVRSRFHIPQDAEIAGEANPGSSDAEKFERMRAAGFNRLSIGVQAFDDTLLTALGRDHTAADAQASFARARSAGFDNINVDLMFGVPEQTMSLWRNTVNRALSLRPEHLSLYALTLEPGTRFERLRRGGKLSLPDEDTVAAMYEFGIDALTRAGYEHYEISNFAQPGRRSRHNQTYWLNEEYLGYGPGAVSYRGGRRWKRERFPDRYVRKIEVGEDLTVEWEQLSPEAALGETMMLGLRMLDGIAMPRVRARFGLDPIALYADCIARRQSRGLLTYEDDVLRLTRRGLLLADDVCADFLAPPRPVPRPSRYV